jgi:tetratricopeptide (TPR) repeat protein
MYSRCHRCESARFFFWSLPILLAALLLAHAAFAQSDAVREHLQKGEAALQENRAAEASQEFNAVLALDPRNVEAHMNLGTIAFSQNNCAEAGQHFRSALAAGPSLAKAQGLLGICEKRLGQSGAQALLQKSFDELKDPKLRIEVGVELADLYYDRGDLDHVVPVVRTLVALDPENIDILFFAQHVYQDMADDTLNKLALLAPGSARMQQVVAEHLVNNGDLAGAIEHYRNALQIDPYLPGAHFELAEAMLESAPQDSAAQAAAEKELDAAVRIDGESARVECAFGREAFLQSNFAAASSHYSRAYALNPNDSTAQLGMARLLMEQASPQEAVKYLRQAVDFDPLNSEAHYRLAMALKALNQNDDAQQQLRLFQEIKQAETKVQQLYRQMNKRSPTEDKGMPGIAAN